MTEAAERRVLRMEVWTRTDRLSAFAEVQGGSNMTGTDLCVNKPHCAATVRT